jgi:hypothetical protein
VTPAAPSPRTTSFIGSMLRPRPLPCVVIRIPFEGRPQVDWNAQTDSDGERLIDWLGTNHELRELVLAALDLQEASR